MNSHNPRSTRASLVLMLAFFASMALAIGPPRLMGQDSAKAAQPQIDNVTEPLKLQASWGIRLVVVILGLAAWFGTQYLIGAKAPLAPEQAEKAGALLTEHDSLLTALGPLNRFLNANPRWANGLLIASSAVIDLLGIFLLLWSVFGPSLRPFLGLIILFGLRQICQALTALPPPAGMIWRYPGFPSLLVTYGVANDLFFSGHTAMAVYGAIELAQLGPPWLIVLAWIIAIFEVLIVLVLRAHYTMDVFAGLITALYISGLAGLVAPSCDQALSQFFR